VIGWLYRLCDTARHRAASGDGTRNRHRPPGRRPGSPLPRAPRLHNRGAQLPAALRRRAKSIWWPGTAARWSSSRSSRGQRTISALRFRNVDQEKRTALLRAARHYARRAGVPWERVRFDLLSVVFSEPPAMTHFPDAFAPIQTL